MITFRRAVLALTLAMPLAMAGAPAFAQDKDLVDTATANKDLASVEGVRQNQLIGYGLVVGLNGTGDTLNNIPFTKQSLQAMLERLEAGPACALVERVDTTWLPASGPLGPFAVRSGAHRGD